MSGETRFTEAIRRVLDYDTLALDRCSTWRPHRKWWRRWLGQQERVVDHKAFLAELQRYKGEQERMKAAG